MSIQRMKETAEVNDELKTAGKEYQALAERVIRQVTTAATDEFTEYMTRNGFEVSRSGNAVTARYHAAEIVLQLPAASDRTIAAIAAFRVRQTGKPVHVIVAMHEGSGFSISSGVATIKEKDELEEAKNQLAEVKKRIESYPSEKIIYRAQIDDDKSSILDARAYDTFSEALQTVVG